MSYQVACLGNNHLSTAWSVSMLFLQQIWRHLLMQPSQFCIGTQHVLPNLISKTATGSNSGSCLNQGVRPCRGNHTTYDPYWHLTVESLTVVNYLLSVQYVCLLSCAINPNGGGLLTDCFGQGILLLQDRWWSSSNSALHYLIKDIHCSTDFFNSWISDFTAIKGKSGVLVLTDGLVYLVQVHHTDFRRASLH